MEYSKFCPQVHPREISVQIHHSTCRRMFIIVLVMVTRCWKQHRSSSGEEKVIRVMYIQQHTLQESEIMNSFYLDNMAKSEGLDMEKKGNKAGDLWHGTIYLIFKTRTHTNILTVFKDRVNMHLHKHRKEELESCMLKTLGWRWQREKQNMIKQKKCLPKHMTKICHIVNSILCPVVQK